MESTYERAKKYSNEMRSMGYSEKSSNLLEYGYFNGAEAQMRIDIDKACEWWINFCNEHGILVYKEHIDAFTKSMSSE